MSFISFLLSYPVKFWGCSKNSIAFKTPKNILNSCYRHVFELENREFSFFFTVSNSAQIWRLIEETRQAGENLNYSFRHQLSATTFIIVLYELSKGEIAMSQCCERNIYAAGGS